MGAGEAAGEGGSARLPSNSLLRLQHSCFHPGPTRTRLGRLSLPDGENGLSPAEKALRRLKKVSAQMKIWALPGAKAVKWVKAKCKSAGVKAV